ncbi:Desumoylating isopeptidase 1 [Oopsacas minuta]|uniref:Desumoylating isopeptidase 1 n=1 Tax=Oopsacas minuta TaxID=111878 RepID=A0AAV7JQH5_9METZ|nr:Desumoylating isopeptidase 1 [Oopsacas minuta]
MNGYSVKLYVYDLSGGLASQLSQSFIGKQIDGIWHTAVVVYGQEYFYGSGGICSCPPGTTMMGPPLRIENMGTTHIPPATFKEFLNEISPDYHTSQYNVMTNNCNNFTNVLLQFLTGDYTPDYILNLPQDVLATPLGQMLLPTIEQMTTQAQSQLPGMSGAMGVMYSVNEYAIPDVIEQTTVRDPVLGAPADVSVKKTVIMNEDEDLD